MRAFIAASAMEEPVTPLIRVESAIEVCARLPYIRPVSTEASFSRFSVMPELLRKLPARMNSGTASSAKFCVSVTVSWIGMVIGNSGCCRKNSTPEMPIAKATGMPISSRTVNAMRTRVTGVSYNTSTAWFSGGLPCRSSRTFSAVVISSSSAPNGRLIVTQE